ncbi:sodium channel protein 1 brain-like isoform X3 [Clytia hemisphaerica]|uniref:sodium channel protein 1 brain-like isoform X3 n=1 Tax=Clytia hemisphaerica TaxID=252671 RepID=UPI0034D69476
MDQYDSCSTISSISVPSTVIFPHEDLQMTDQQISSDEAFDEPNYSDLRPGQPECFPDNHDIIRCSCGDVTTYDSEDDYDYEGNDYELDTRILTERIHNKKGFRKRRDSDFVYKNTWENVGLSHKSAGVFLKDFDRSEDDTFLVLASRLGKVYVYRFSKAKSLWAFGPTNPIRKIIIYLITNQIFEFFVILTILVNCVFLALNDAPEEAEYFFTAIYTTEMVLKIIAKGFVLHNFAYLRDPWNWLDFVVVLLGYVTLAPTITVNFHGIRTFRVLRALRTISAIEGLKTMVNALLKSMRMLSDVLILTAFFLCVFALVGLQLFSGQFHNRCVHNNFTISPYNTSWSSHVSNETNWYKEFTICGNNTGSRQCPTNYTCLPHAGPNPNYGFTSYDDFGWALLTSFQLVTLDYWEDVYLHIASSMGPWYVLYFMIVIFFGSFYLINLVLAVVAVSYQQETAQNADLESQYEFLREVAASYSLHKRILPKLLFDDSTIDDISNLPCVKKGPSVIILSSTKNNKSKRAANKSIAFGRCFHVSKRTVSESSNADSEEPQNPQQQEESSAIARKKLTNVINRVKMDRERDKLKDERNKTEDVAVVGEHGRRKLNIASVKSVGRTLYVPTTPGREGEELDSSRDSKNLNSSNTSAQNTFSLNGKTALHQKRNKTENALNTSGASHVTFNEQLTNQTHSTKPTSTSAARNARLARNMAQIEHPLPYANIEENDLTCLQLTRRKVYRFVMSPWFELAVTIFILLNTVCLAIEHHNMDKNIEFVLQIANHVFTGIFILEMVLKLIALGLIGYTKSMWNIFDGLVVLMSIVDVIIEITIARDNGDFTIIRSLRLFRVLKLAQSWSTMRLLLSAIGRSLNALGNLTLILGIIVYMFAVVGTKVFGASYVAEKFPENKVPHWNFSNFGHSIMMIFRVLCGEWIEPLYHCMLATGTWAAAFFMLALIVGNFLVLNLFLALLLNSFADQAMEEELKKRSFIKSKLKWVSSTRKLAKLQKAFKGQKVFPNGEMSLAAASKLALAKKREEEAKNGGGCPSKPALEKKTSFEITSKTSPRNTEAHSDSECPQHQNNENTNNTNKTTKSNNNTLTIANFNELTSPTNGSISGRHMALSPTPSIFSNHSKLNGTTASIASSVALHKLDPLCPKTYCCCFGRKNQNSTTTPGGQQKRPSSSALPGKSEWKMVWMRFQGKVKKLVEHKWFDSFILLLILSSSFVLVFEDIRLPERPQLQTALDILNIVFSVLFLIECILKIIGFGVAGYIKNPWNLLDFIIVSISITSIVLDKSSDSDSGNLKTLRSLRTLRALRPLRAVSRWDGMRIVVNSLLKAIPSIGNVLLVCLVFWLIFSILGVQIFGGRFYKCVDGDGNILDYRIIPNRTECDRHPQYYWKNSNVNFDNSLNGFLPLFQVATFEGWIEVMKDAIDATEVDKQPIPGNNFSAYIYFVIFIIVGAFFILNLFISVIIDNFYRLKKQYDDCGTVEVFLTTEQKQWFSTVKKALTKKPKRIIHRPKNFYQAKLFDFIISPKFESFTMILIFVNIILMMFQHYQQSTDYDRMLYVTNLVFTVIFSIELILRIVALRQQYFLDRWNIFDLGIVILSLIGIVLEYLDVVLQVTPSVLRVARVLRIGRLLRYFNSAKGIRRLLVALVISLPALFNIGALLFLILFIYAIIGMSNFGYVKKNGALNEVVNFETFGSSMMVLFRLATSAGWNEVLDALMISEPDCDPNLNSVPNGNCGTPWIAVAYFVTFILITYLIIVNMYIAVILENFNQAHEQEEIGITDEDIEMFYAVWQLYDPLATQFIDYEKLPFLVANLGPPLGIPFPNKVAVHNLDLPMNDSDEIHCIDVLQALLKRVLGNIENTDTEHYDNMRKTIDMKLQAAFPMRQKEDHKTTTMERLQQVKAASTIQRHFRSWKARSIERQHRISIGVTDENSLQVHPEETHKSSLQRLFTDNKLTRTLSSLSIRSPFARRRLDSSSSQETKTKSPITRSLSAYSGRKSLSRPVNFTDKSPPTKTRSILRSSESGGSPSSGKLSQNTLNSSSISSSTTAKKMPVRKRGHQVSFYTPPSIDDATAPVLETEHHDHLDGIAPHEGDDDIFYSDDDSNSDTDNEAPKDEKCACSDCKTEQNEASARKGQPANIHLIAPYKKPETAPSSVGSSKNSGGTSSSIANKSLINSLTSSQKTDTSVKTHQLTSSSINSSLSVRDMPNVKL